MIFGPDTHTDDFLQAHTGRFWRHNLRARGDICKRSGVRFLFEPPFFKAPYKRCLFCWLAFPIVLLKRTFLFEVLSTHFCHGTHKGFFFGFFYSLVQKRPPGFMRLILHKFSLHSRHCSNTGNNSCK